MKQNFLFTVFICCSAMGNLFFTACGGGGTAEQHSTPALDSLLADSSLMGGEAVLPENGQGGEANGNNKPAKLAIKNDLDYAPEFLKELTYSGIAKQITLSDSLLILEGTDTMVFPRDLPKDKWSNFVAMKAGYMYSLDISKVNYTTVEFNFELRKGRQVADQIKGKASLNPGFFLGSESDDDPESGTSYFANEYHFESPDCSLNIRLGEDEGVKKVKLIKQCKSGKFNIALADSPILLEK